ncbi:MAG TPA: DUF4129 domain-containing protein [Blastocatellia bacterium]|nr:DUF4129 domain-containing protein [Blastocatellia bacterium]
MRTGTFSTTRVAACCLLVCGLFILSAKGATTLSDYRVRVARATEEAQTVIDYNTRGLRYQEGLEEIKRQLPQNLEVEQDGQVVTVDNRWLHASVDSFASEKDSALRNAVMEKAVARLLAVADHIDLAEHEGAGESSANAKAKEIVSRSEYLPRGDNPVTKFIKEQWAKVARFLSELYATIMTAIFGSGGDASLVSRIIIILLLALALFGAARLAMKINFDRAKKRKRTVLGEEIEAGVTAADLAEAGMAAARSGDFRLAMRKLYLSLLYELVERDLIELAPELTNREYLERVSKFAPLVEPMRQMTERFDQVWYGMFPFSQADFSTYLASYREASGRAKTIAAT